MNKELAARLRDVPIVAICASCEAEWNPDVRADCPDCGNDGDIEGHIYRRTEDVDLSLDLLLNLDNLSGYGAYRKP